MRNKCKPGFICIENISIVIFLKQIRIFLACLTKNFAFISSLSNLLISRKIPY